MQVSTIVKSQFPEGTDLTFRFITLFEPRKKELVPFLELEAAGTIPSERPARQSRVQVNLQDSEKRTQLFEFVINVDTKTVASKQHLGGRHSFIDAEFMTQVEAACLADSRIQTEITSLQLPEKSTVIIEPWAYATDGTNDVSRRTTMVWEILR